MFPLMGNLAHRQVIPGQRSGYPSMATVRFVEVHSGPYSLGDEAAVCAGSVDRDASAEWPESALRALPVRPVGHRCFLPRIRPLDDPEILERVLEGLINLA